MSADVLIPVDAQNPVESDKAIKQAVRLAQEQQGMLHVLTVVTGFNMPIVASYFPDDAMEHALHDVEKSLQDYIEQHTPDDCPTQLHVKSGNPYKEIIKLAHKLDISMIVIPSHKHSRLNKVLLGSVASKVVERATCSVLVVRG